MGCWGGGGGISGCLWVGKRGGVGAGGGLGVPGAVWGCRGGGLGGGVVERGAQGAGQVGFGIRAECALGL